MNQILKKINELNEIQKGGTKGKRLIKSQEKLSSLFDDLTKNFNNNNNNNIKIVNEDNNKIQNEDNNKIVNEDNNVNENNDNNNKSDDDYDEKYYEIKQINNTFKKIDKTKSFEDQIDILKKYQG